VLAVAVKRHAARSGAERGGAARYCFGVTAGATVAVLLVAFLS